MKFTRGEVVYVQEQDLQLLVKAKRVQEIPSVVLDGSRDIIGCSELANPEEYIPFSGEGVINFFNSVGYIMDLNLARSLSWSETVGIGEKVLVELNKVQRQLDSLTDATDEKRQEVIDRLDILRYELEYVKKMMNDKKGRVTFTSMPKKGIGRSLLPPFLRSKSGK